MENESDVAAFKDFKDDPSAAPAPPKPAPPPAAAPPPPSITPSAPAAPPPPAPTSSTASFPLSGKGRVFASPLAKRLAEEKGLSLEVSP